MDALKPADVIKFLVDDEQPSEVKDMSKVVSSSAEKKPQTKSESTPKKRKYSSTIDQIDEEKAKKALEHFKHVNEEESEKIKEMAKNIESQDEKCNMDIDSMVEENDPNKNIKMEE